MFLISKKRIYLFFIFILIAFVFIGVHGYLTFSKAESGDLMTLKYFTENFIYYILIIILVLTILFATTLVRSSNIYKELEKVIELSQQGKYSSGTQLKKLGKLGEKIIDINSRLNSLNEMKSLKISSLSNTINFMLEKSDMAIVLVDAQGMIIKISQHMAEQLEFDSKEILNKYAENVFDKFNFSNVIAELRKSKYITMQSPFKLESFSEPLDVNMVIYPIYNYKNEIANCIFSLITKEEFLSFQAIKKEVKNLMDQKKLSQEVQNLPLFKRFKDIFS